MESIRVYMEMSEYFIFVGGKILMKELKQGTNIYANHSIYVYMQMADRAWEESNKGVKLIKHRFNSSDEVDMEEFMWIKLRADTI